MSSREAASSKTILVSRGPFSNRPGDVLLGSECQQSLSVAVRPPSQATDSTLPFGTVCVFVCGSHEWQKVVCSFFFNLFPVFSFSHSGIPPHRPAGCSLGVCWPPAGQCQSTPDSIQLLIAVEQTRRTTSWPPKKRKTFCFWTSYTSCITTIKYCTNEEAFSWCSVVS